MAVYTKVSETEVAAFLRDYKIGDLRELIGIKQGVENSNYLLYTTEDRYILTLYEKRVREEDLPFYLGLMRHLAGKGIPCSTPVLSNQGSVLGRLAGRPAAIIHFRDGKAPKTITPHMCTELGRVLAAMHRAGADFPYSRSNDLSLTGWNRLADATKARAGEVLPGLGDIIEDELRHLKDCWPNNLPQGVIHADLFPDNVFFEDDRLCGVIDFYFACNDLLAYDLAVCLNAWCFETNIGFNITKARALIRGYNEVRPLSLEEKQALPLLARGSALRFMLTRLYDWLNQVPDALVKPKDPLDYLTRLQFHQMVGDVAAYGLDT